MKVKKKLYRNQKNKKLAGVCSGLAEYFEIDVTLIRIIWIVFILLGGAGIISYLISILIIPQKPDSEMEIEVLESKKKPKLSLNKDDKFIFGVCGGLGKYFEIDSSIIRILFVVLIFSVGFGILLYLLLAIAIPKEKI